MKYSYYYIETEDENLKRKIKLYLNLKGDNNV